MESVDETSASATSDAVGTNPEKKPTVKPADRVSLGKAECAAIDRWLMQVNESSRGFLTLTRSDVVNFLVRTHKDELTPKELSQIRSDHYDPLRHIAWIATQMKSALNHGDHPRVAILQKEIHGIELVKQSAGSKAPSDTIKHEIARPTTRKRRLSKAESHLSEQREPHREDEREILK